MTHMPSAAGPPAPPVPHVPAQPGALPGTGSGPSADRSAPPPGPPARRSAWAETTARLRAAATTEPGRLRIIGAVLAALVVAFGAVTALEIADRASSADAVVNRSQPLSADAASIYRSLADADTAAASGFLAGAQEPEAVRERYRADIASASRLLVKAAGNTDGSTDSRRWIATLNEQLPRYTGLVERARANNRQGLPLGGAYLRYANQLMTTELLPAAQKLYEEETARLDDDHGEARKWPFLSLGLGVVALGGLAWAQRRNYRRTNRVFNHGLLAATAASTVVLLWLGVGHGVARAGLDEARAKGQESLKVLNDARISSLKARANENLTLVARGAVLTADGKNDKYETDYTAGMSSLTASLGRAGRLADDGAGRTPVADAVSAASEWKNRHKDAGETDRAGDYDRALAKVIGSEGSTGQCFDRVDAALEKALAHEQAEFTESAEGGRGALAGLPVGAAVLAVLAAAGAVLGVGRRLSEYR
ncbi:hypothetical protein QMZ92_09045 [Streptomyces sp. HNM0645]|uniref:hypothetical protein n=1 Tax=Streptomyces sp. HNM0645 TaxID=2782343 RepID=UPI0024B71BEF|nr:hypothetical protein [Streptomyces sp. HNM0645]MDI9884541.1 hypothetical protein [Streptomyces sp. HNM0645]